LLRYADDGGQHQDTDREQEDTTLVQHPKTGKHRQLLG
jgi:hypothetical protein